MVFRLSQKVKRLEESWKISDDGEKPRRHQRGSRKVLILSVNPVRENQQLLYVSNGGWPPSTDIQAAAS